jgi:hypothetical protein
VTCHNPTAADKFLNSIEAVCEILRILNCRNIAAYLAKALSKGRTTKALLVEAEVDMIEA